MNDLPPILSCLEMRERAAVLSARPGVQRWLVATGAATVLEAAIGTLAWSSNDARWKLAFWCLFIVWLVLLTLTAIVARARYIFTFDFAARSVQVMEIRGFDRPARWQGSFDDTSSIAFGAGAKGRRSATLRWRDPDAAAIQMFLLHDDTRSRAALQGFHRQLSEAGLHGHEEQRV